MYCIVLHWIYVYKLGIYIDIYRFMINYIDIYHNTNNLFVSIMFRLHATANKTTHSNRNIETPDLLNKSGDVNIVNSNGNKYVFNNGSQYISQYTIGSIGEYIFRNVPIAHPIAVLNKQYNGTSKPIKYSVIDDKPIIIRVSGGFFFDPFYNFFDENINQINLVNGSYQFMKDRTYRFLDTGISSSHPFKIVYLNNTISFDNNKRDENGKRYIDLKMSNTDTVNYGSLYFQCERHSNMIGYMHILNKTVSETGENGNGKYDFYHGDVKLTVDGDFGSVSVYCFYHGYMGGKDILRFSELSLSGPFIKYNPQTAEKEFVTRPKEGEPGYDVRLDTTSNQYDKNYNPFIDKGNALYNSSRDPSSPYFAGEASIPGNDNFNVNVWMDAVDGRKMGVATYGKVSSNLVTNVNSVKSLFSTNPSLASTMLTDLRINNRVGFRGLIASSRGFNGATFQNNIANKSFKIIDPTKFDIDIYGKATASVLSGTLNSVQVENINTTISNGETNILTEGASLNGTKALLSGYLITMNEIEKGAETTNGKYAKETFSDVNSLAKVAKKSEIAGKQCANIYLNAIEDTVSANNALIISKKDADITCVDVADAVNKTGITALGLIAGKSAAMGASAAITSIEKLKEVILLTPTDKDKQNADDNLPQEAKKWVEQGLLPLYYKNNDDDGFTALVIGPTNEEKQEAIGSLTDQQKENIDNGTAELVMKWNSDKKKFEGDGIKSISENNDSGNDGNGPRQMTRGLSPWVPSWDRNVATITNNYITQNNKVNTREASNSVKANVLAKYEQISSVLNSTIIGGLLKDTATLNGIMEDVLSSTARIVNHPELTVVKNYNGGNSDYSGVKRAVLIGINYELNDKLTSLAGCINDAMALRGMLMDTYQYKNENISVLRDDGRAGYVNPTRENIIQSIRDAVNLSKEEDELWIHFSGHGSFVVDNNKDEVDNRDEGIIPSDFDEDTIKIILDDELKPLLNEVKGTVMITQDCCNSGSGWDLPFKYTKQNDNTYKRTIEGTMFSHTTTDNIYMLSGSTDDQEAIETNDRLGAFTNALIESLRLRNHTVTFTKLEDDINKYLEEQGHEQRTVFTSANYNIISAGITRSMVTGSNAPQYRY